MGKNNQSRMFLGIMEITSRNEDGLSLFSFNSYIYYCIENDSFVPIIMQNTFFPLKMDGG